MKLDGLHKLTRKMYKEVLEPAKAQKNKYLGYAPIHYEYTFNS